MTPPPQRLALVRQLLAVVHHRAAQQRRDSAACQRLLWQCTRATWCSSTPTPRSGRAVISERAGVAAFTAQRLTAGTRLLGAGRGRGAEPVCCAGCEAAARLILSQGLGRYYEFRRAAGASRRAGRARTGRRSTATAALRRYTHERADGDAGAEPADRGPALRGLRLADRKQSAAVAGRRQITSIPAAARAELRFDPHARER